MRSIEITDYDLVFALHTGVTIMMQKLPAFDASDEDDLPFTIAESPEQAVLIKAKSGETVKIKNIKPNILTEIKERGFIMIYELDGEDMARCTPCHLVV